MDSSQKKYLKDRLSKLQQEIYDLAAPKLSTEEVLLAAQRDKINERLGKLRATREEPSAKCRSGLQDLLREARGKVLFMKAEEALPFVEGIESKVRATLAKMKGKKR